MADSKKYYIEINGIKESVDAVDSLLKKLDNLEQRIDALNQKGIKVEGSGGSSGGGSKSRVSDLTAEQKIIDQINRSQEKRQALEGEIGKMLADEKQAMKELNAEQKSLAAKDRLAAGGYDSNTMLGMKAELADIKAAMQTMQVGSDEMLKAAQRADELNSKLKEIEFSYGQFGRNVGNYPTAIIDEMKGITIALGDQRLQFNSTREALRTLRENIKSMTVEGKQNTEEYKNNVQALHELEMALQEADSAINDVKVSSEGMDEALDWMQSFGAMGQITQGFSSFFGNTGFEESIQKMMSLQSMLQGLEELRKQMNTGEGFGGMFKTMSQGADEAATKILRVKGGMEGLATASKTTQVAVKGLSVAIKALSSIGLMFLIEGAMKLAEKVGNLVGGLFGWNKENENLVQSSDVAAAAIEYENKQFERMQDQLKKDFLLGLISQEEYLAQKADLATEAMQRQIKAYQDYLMLSEDIDDDARENLKGINGERDLGEAGGLIPTPPVIAKSREELEKYFQTYQDMVDNGKNQTAEMYGWLGDLLEELPLVGTDGVEDAKKVMTNIGQTALGEFSNMYQHAMETMKTDTKAAEEEMKVLLDFMNGQMLSTVFANLDQYVPVEGIRLRLQQMKTEVQNFVNGISFTGNDLEQLKLDALPSKQRRRALIDKEYEEDKKKFADNAEAMKLVEKKHQNQLNELAEKGGKKRTSTAKKTAKETLDVEKETQRMKLNLMAEGFQKELTRLKYERDEKLRKYKGHKELELLAQQEYDKKSEELRNKHMDEERKAYRDMYQDIFSYIADARQREIETLDDTMEQLRKRAERGRSPLIYDTFGFYSSLGKGRKGGKKEGDDMYSVIDKQLEGVSSNMKEIIEDINLYIDEAIRISKEEGRKAKSINELFAGENEIFINVLKEQYGRDYDDEKWDEIKELFGEKQTATFEDLIKTLTVFRLREENALKTFVENEEDLKQYYGQLLQRMSEKDRTFDEPEMYKKYQEWVDKRKQVIDAEIQREYLELEESYDNLAKKEQDFYNNKINNAEKGSEEQLFYQRQLNDKLAQLEQEYTKKQQAVHEKYQRELAKVDEEAFQKRTADLKAYFDDMQQEFRDYYEVIVSLSEKMPKRNEFGFINVKETNKGYRETIENLKKLNTEVMQVIFNVGALHSAGKISTEDYKNYTRELMRMVGDIQQKMKEAQEGLSWEGKIQDFFQNLQQYYSAISDSFQTILSEFQNNQDYMIERQMDALDKENEELQKKLDENEKILERHKNNVEKIEGQLADARGDRRERLIDALNQEIIAQRRAQAEKEKLEKEQEKIEERQKELEKKQREYEYQRGLQQILFQTSQAVMQAATNKWPIPAIPLMALAAATGATQYALARQRKPYAEGGILDGLSHENGGIPVGNSNIEVEGGEYVVNKRSTANNTELLNLINNSDRQLTPSDLMNFATNMSVSPLDVNMPESSSLETAFVAYAQRPIVVDVREITSRQESVRNVQVLSGIR